MTAGPKAGDAAPALLRELAANLASRRGMGLTQVTGGREELERLLAVLSGEPSSRQQAPSDGRATQAGPHPEPQTPEFFPGPPSAPETRPAAPALAGPDAGPVRTLAQVREELGDCTRCGLAAGRANLVFGVGPEDAALMLIGEGPGHQEDLKGEPFVGPAGQLLDRMLAAVGFQRREVYIANIVKCRPPNNRDPEPEEIAACRPFLEGQIRAIAPRAILTLGRPAAQSLLNTKAPIGKLRGRWTEALGVPVLPTFHPAYLLRNPAAKGDAYRDLKLLAQTLGKD